MSEKMLFQFFRGSLRSEQKEKLLKCLRALKRKAKIKRDHLAVLSHYGKRGVAPNIRNEREHRAAVLWAEAINYLASEFENKLHSACTGQNEV